MHDYGEDYRPEESSRRHLSVEPPKVGAAQYGTLVAQVDADGNDLGGIRNVFVQVPIGTYTGWNLFNRSFYEDGFCTLQGSFIPFARTRQERLDAGDPRLSIEERYPSKEAYVGRNQEGGGRPRRRSLSAARGREPAGVASRARGGAARALTTVSGIIEHHVRACPAHPDWSGTVPS